MDIMVTRCCILICILHVLNQYFIESVLLFKTTFAELVPHGVETGSQTSITVMLNFHHKYRFKPYSLILQLVFLLSLHSQHVFPTSTRRSTKGPSTWSY